mgnify:CR=1 FL=1
MLSESVVSSACLFTASDFAKAVRALVTSSNFGLGELSILLTST